MQLMEKKIYATVSDEDLKKIGKETMKKSDHALRALAGEKRAVATIKKFSTNGL